MPPLIPRTPSAGWPHRWPAGRPRPIAQAAGLTAVRTGLVARQHGLRSADNAVDRTIDRVARALDRVAGALDRATRALAASPAAAGPVGLPVLPASGSWPSGPVGFGGAATPTSSRGRR